MFGRIQDHCPQASHPLNDLPGHQLETRFRSEAIVRQQFQPAPASGTKTGTIVSDDASSGYFAAWAFPDFYQMPALNQFNRTLSYGLAWQRSKTPFLIRSSKILTCRPHQTQVETGIYFIVGDGPNALRKASRQTK
jgi:hypothetical protein